MQMPFAYAEVLELLEDIPTMRTPKRAMFTPLYDIA